jgi:hypothetical protein
MEAGMSELLQALMNSTQDDVLAVRERLKQLENELSCMKELERVLSRRFPSQAETNPTEEVEEANSKSSQNEQSSKPNKGGRPVKNETKKSRIVIASFLNEDGPASAEDIKNRLGFSSDSVRYLLNCNWFSKSSDGRYSLTTSGACESELNY